jgi:hypothetical protein
MTQPRPDINIAGRFWLWEETVVDDDTLTDRGGQAAPPEIAVPILYVALQCARPEAGAARHSLANTDRVLIGRAADPMLRRDVEKGTRTLFIGIPDPHLSARHAHIDRVGDEFFAQDLGSRNGTRINGVRLDGRSAIADGDLVEVGHTLLLYRAAALVALGSAPDVALANDDGAMPLETLEPSLAQGATLLASVAKSTSPVLLLGETGTGKEVVARAVHRLSGRQGSFVAVNCGALPATLVEAQLFGHVRGAFSGALTNAPGLLRAADGGTLLLDEVGDLPEPSQAALLRVLQEREVLPVGAVQPIKVDLRVLAATHKPLTQLAAQSKFREDLLARLTGYSFTIPPLRERREDIGLMVAAFARERPLTLLPAAGRALLRYDWPHNVRELRHALGIAATLAKNGPIDLAHLPPAVARAPSRPPPPPASAVAELERQRLIASLARHRGNVTEVARELGKARMQVQRWMKKYGLEGRLFR